MGWDSCSAWRSKEDVAQDLTELAPGWGRMAGPTFRREQGQWVLWQVLLTPEGTGLIACALVNKVNGVWGYKLMDETVSPYYYSCPREFLTLAQPAPDSEYSRDWRARVLAQAEVTR